jgi:CHAD domain-containing protein
MAKAAKISENVDLSDPQGWLAEVLRVRFDEVLQFCDAALDPTDAEGVHDMRVATRRLRSVLRDFADVLGKHTLSGLTRPLKRLADALGKVRDLDVLIEELENLGDVPECPVRDGIEQITAIYRERRIAAQRVLENRLTGEFVLDLRTRFNAALESTIRQRRLFELADMGDEARRAITKCLKEFQDLSEVIYYPFSTKRIHKLRIAGKHLRYAIELFSPHFGDALKPFADGMKGMQKHLGDLHDCDVWIAEIRTHIPQKRRTPEDPKPTAAVWLISQFTHRRTRAYRDALELWSVWEAEGFREKLVELVSQSII